MPEGLSGDYFAVQKSNKVGTRAVSGKVCADFVQFGEGPRALPMEGVM
jgi:hypothetical protein